MATSIIPNPNQYETTTLGTSSYTGNITYHKGMVTKYDNARAHIELSCKSTTDIPTNVQIASVPEGYRPKSDSYLPAIMASSSGWFAGNVKVGSNGVISQGLTGYMREVVVDGWYNI